MTEFSVEFEQDALVERLTSALYKRPREVVFLVGAPLSAPQRPLDPGVPGVEGIIALIKQEFEGDSKQEMNFERVLAASAGNSYQAAFTYLQGRRGQETSNEIVRKAVWLARTEASEQGFIGASEDSCSRYDFDDKWHLTSATEALGQLAVLQSGIFGKNIITTNFDPLLGVAIRRAGGVYYKTILHRDGNIGQTTGSGCHIMHLHGYWYGSDTLHTGRQLGQSRPRLKASLANLLRNKIVVVCAYSGWDDVFTSVLMEVVADDAASPEVLWTFFSDCPDLDSRLVERLVPGLDRGRVVLYKGIDCHNFIPELTSWWKNKSTSIAAPPVAVSTSTVTAAALTAASATLLQRIDVRPLMVEGDNEDRPPCG